MIGLIAMFAAAVHGDFVNGNQLLAMCETNGVECARYTEAVSDTLDAMEGMGGMKEYYCSTNGVTVGQIRDIVLKYLREHPESRNEGAAGIAFVALADVFPCRAGGSAQ